MKSSNQYTSKLKMVTRLQSYYIFSVQQKQQSYNIFFNSAKMLFAQVYARQTQVRGSILNNPKVRCLDRYHYSIHRLNKLPYHNFAYCTLAIWMLSRPQSSRTCSANLKKSDVCPIWCSLA